MHKKDNHILMLTTSILICIVLRLLHILKLDIDTMVKIRIESVITWLCIIFIFGILGIFLYKFDIIISNLNANIS